MSSKITVRPHHSLAFRLTLWYGGIFTVSAVVTFLFFYLLITNLFRGYTDQELTSQAGGFAAMLDAGGIEAVKQAAWREAQAGGEKKIFVRLLSRKGQVFSSSNMSYWQDIPINQNLTRQVSGGNPAFETIDIPGRRHEVRILYAALAPGLFLQLGRSMENTTRFIEAFRRIFLVAMSLLIVLAAGVGWFMARRALSGVATVTRTARRIAGGALDQRVPVKSQGDEIDQLALTFNNMLDRIKALVDGIKEMNDNIAHDLRSPITRIRGLAEVTLTAGKSLGDYESMAASTIEECDRLLDMINTMLAISRTEAGVGELYPQPLDLAGVLRDACELFQPAAEDKQVTLTCTVEGPGRFNGDVRMIQRMVANVVDNAIKYTPAGGEVSVGFKGEGPQFSITIQDTGIGIAENELDNVFERFYRCDQSRSQSGVGLGLSLARAIARAHGGDIEVYSRPGNGSRFSILLPKDSILPA
jgi:heavy metal sensor kinase